jgi:hypothetical protein
VGALFGVTGCVAGPVVDKRAPGELGDKTYQLQVENEHAPGDPTVWVTVTEDVWEQCGMGESMYPDCAD